MPFRDIFLLILFNILFIGCDINSLENALEDSPTTLYPSKITLLNKPQILHSPDISEASDIAYNDETQTLYIIGDKGTLYSYNVHFNNNQLVLDYQDTKTISYSNPNIKIDSEGLTTNETNELIISLEGKPRISQVSTNGKIIKDYPLPKELNKITNYVNSNKMLESVTWHKDYGILTAAEYPLKGKNNTEQTIYSLNGKKWNFSAEPYTNNAITAIEVMDDENLLILERAYKEGAIPSFYITLKKLYLEECDSTQTCKTEILYSEKLDFKNYEGLAKIGVNHYLMITDNQDKLSTDYIYFKIE